MSGEVVAASQVLHFAAMIVLAAWVLILDPTHRVHRAFALVVAVRGLTVGLNFLVALDPTDAFRFGIRGYFLVAQVFTLVNFFLVYNWRRPRPGVRRARWALLAAAVLAELVYLLNHDLVVYYDPARGQRPGPLGILSTGFTVGAALIALWFAVAAARTTVRAQVRFHRLVSLAFAAAAIVDSVLPWTLLATSGVGFLFPDDNSLGASLSSMMFLTATPLALAAVGVLVAGLAKEAAPRAQLAWTMGLAAACVAIPMTGAILRPDRAPGFDGAAITFYAFLTAARLVFPILAGYAVARQALSYGTVFELDYRVKVAISRSTVGAILVAMFFVVSEGSAQLLGDLAALRNIPEGWSEIFGIVGAGVLLVFLHPLHRMGQRVSDSVLPEARAPGDLAAPARLKLYEEQVQIAWADGTLTSKERLLLDRLRERLEIPLEDAARVENQAARAF